MMKNKSLRPATSAMQDACTRETRSLPSLLFYRAIARVESNDRSVVVAFSLAVPVNMHR